MRRFGGFILLALGIIVTVVGGIVFAAMLMDRRAGFAIEGMIFGGCILVVGVVLLILAWVVLRGSRPFGIGKFADGDAIDGTYHQFVANLPQQAELLDRTYTTLYQPPIKGKNGRPSLLRVCAPTPCELEFTITRQTWFDRFAKRIGLVIELESGDPEFDAAFYIRTDANEFVQAFVNDPAKRRAIRELFHLGFAEVALRDNEFQANWTGFDPAKNDQQELLAEAAAHLFILGEDLPFVEPDLDESPSAQRQPAHIALWVAALGLAPAFLWAFWYKPVFISELIVAALPIVIPAYAAYLVSAVLLLRGTSTAHDRWARLFWVGMLTFALGGTGAVAAANAMLDRAAPKLHQTTIVDKRSSRSRNSTTYYVACNSWRPGGERIEFTVSSSEFNRVQIGQSRLDVTASPGWLGVEWVVERHLVLQPRKL